MRLSSKLLKEVRGHIALTGWSSEFRKERRPGKLMKFSIN
jgi:hypothetical protein